jgi:hypothetical protein
MGKGLVIAAERAKPLHPKGGVMPVIDEAAFPPASVTRSSGA